MVPNELLPRVCKGYVCIIACACEYICIYIYIYIIRNVHVWVQLQCRWGTLRCNHQWLIWRRGANPLGLSSVVDRGDLGLVQTNLNRRYWYSAWPEEYTDLLCERSSGWFGGDGQAARSLDKSQRRLFCEYEENGYQRGVPQRDLILMVSIYTCQETKCLNLNQSDSIELSWGHGHDCATRWELACKVAGWST